jgi:CNT family concentrative nucleoside transporter
LVIAKLLCPETQTPQTSGGISFKIERTDANLIDAATRGTTEGMYLALNVGAMLIAFTALVALLNALYGYSFSLIGIPSASFDQHLGYVMIPFAWLLGIPWQDTHIVGQLLAKKTAFNEYLAYLDFAALLTANPDTLSPRSRLITAYALCGFANFASIGIQVGGISVLAPSRRAELSQIALPAMIGGFIATCTGACVIGIIY